MYLRSYWLSNIILQQIVNSSQFYNQLSAHIVCQLDHDNDTTHINIYELEKQPYETQKASNLLSHHVHS